MGGALGKPTLERTNKESSRDSSVNVTTRPENPHAYATVLCSAAPQALLHSEDLTRYRILLYDAHCPIDCTSCLIGLENGTNRSDALIRSGRRASVLTHAIDRTRHSVLADESSST